MGQAGEFSERLHSCRAAESIGLAPHSEADRRGGRGGGGGAVHLWSRKQLCSFSSTARQISGLKLLMIQVVQASRAEQTAAERDL